MPAPELRRRALTGAVALLVALVAWMVIAPPGIDAGSGPADGGGTESAAFADEAFVAAGAPTVVQPPRVAGPERAPSGVHLLAMAVAVLAGALATLEARSASRRVATSPPAGRVSAWLATPVGRRAPPVLSV